MSLTLQLVLSSLMLIVCSAFHIFLLAWAAQFLRKMSNNHRTRHRRNGLAPHHWAALISSSFLTIIFAHTAQVWAWAISFLALGALSDIGDAIYFALTTYTTLGYGDVTVSNDFRVYAAMASVNGLLNFGLSTAFLVGLLTRLLPDKLE